MENLNLFIRSIFIDNMIFAYFLGMCSFLAVSKNVKTAFGLGIAVTFMLVVTLPINYLLDTYVLQPGALAWLGEGYETVDLSFLGLIMFIAVIASMTQLVEMAVEKFSPSLYASLGNSAVYGLGSGIGWLLAIVGIAAIREKIAYSNVPAPLKGIGITFIITGLMGIAFMSFLGIKI